MEVGKICLVAGLLMLATGLLFPDAINYLPLATLSIEDYELELQSQVTLPFEVTPEWGGATSTRWGRKTWIIDGVHYVFWAEKGGVYYALSENGVTWSKPIYVTKGQYDYGEVFATDYVDGMFGVMVKCWEYLLYKSGAIVDNYIDFGETQTAYKIWDPSLGGGTADHYFTFDSNGYPWLSWTHNWGPENEKGWGVFVSTSKYNDGRWETKEGYPLRVRSFRMCDRLQRLPNGKLYLFYGTVGLDALQGRLYNGISWEAPQPVTAKDPLNVYIGETWSYDVVADNFGNMHLVYNSGDLRYSFWNRMGKTWSMEYEESLVSGLQSSCAAKLCYDNINNVIYLFWSPTGQSSRKAVPNSKLYYKIWINGKWQQETYEVIDESENGGISRGDSINVVPFVTDNKIGIVYPVGEGRHLRYLVLQQKGYGEEGFTSRLNYFNIFGGSLVAVGVVMIYWRKIKGR